MILKYNIIGNIILALFMLPWTIVSYVIGLLFVLAFVANPTTIKFRDWGWVTMDFRLWAAKLWGHSLTLGNITFFNRKEPRLIEHELRHKRQFEDVMIQSAFVGAAIFPFTDLLFAFIIWSSGGFWLLGSYLGGALRWGFSNGYEQSEIERSADAQTEQILPGGHSWSDYRRMQKEAEEK